MHIYLSMLYPLLFFCLSRCLPFQYNLIICVFVSACCFAVTSPMNKSNSQFTSIVLVKYCCCQIPVLLMCDKYCRVMPIDVKGKMLYSKYHTGSLACA